VLTLAAACASPTATPAPGTPGAGSPSPGSTTAGPSPSSAVVASGIPPATPPAGSPSEGPGDPRGAAALATLTSDTDLVDQLLFLGWDGSKPASIRATLAGLRPGGIVFAGDNGNRASAARAINRAIAAGAQALGMLPPFRAIDHEGGRIQRIDDVPNLGSNEAFAATHPSDLAGCKRGADQAATLAAMGFDMNLAPVLDVVTNPKNTVIGDRSYGPDPKVVARLGAAYISGLQGAGIMAVAKHFPGHGATAVDSHLGLPVLRFGLPRLEQVELVPFERALQSDADVAAVMVGHIALPKIDSSGAPASLSRPVVDGILRTRLGFDGLVMTDDVGSMQAVTGNYTAGVAAVMAISAGVDMLMVVRDSRTQVESRDALLDALASGALSRARLMDAVVHILEAKARYGLLGGAGLPLHAC
jgi:beta-N-acetylhexosaminidase